MLAESYEKAKELLAENREVMDRLAEFLIEKETITGKEFMKIFRELKGIPEPEEKKEDVKEKTEPESEETKESDTVPEEVTETVNNDEPVTEDQ